LIAEYSAAKCHEQLVAPSFDGAPVEDEEVGAVYLDAKFLLGRANGGSAGLSAFST